MLWRAGGHERRGRRGRAGTPARSRHRAARCAADGRRPGDPRRSPTCCGRSARAGRAARSTTRCSGRRPSCRSTSSCRRCRPFGRACTTRWPSSASSTIVVGASVRLRRPHDQATLHFFWLTVAFFGALAFTASGRYDQLDYFFDWADLVARLLLPPLFLHFALVFPDRPDAWVRDPRRAMGGRRCCTCPAAVLGGARVACRRAEPLHGPATTRLALDGSSGSRTLYLAVCLLGGLALMRRRSPPAVGDGASGSCAGSSGDRPWAPCRSSRCTSSRSWSGAVPSYASTRRCCSAVSRSSFASALVRYRLMDIEVIIKRVLLVAAVGGRCWPGSTAARCGWSALVLGDRQRSQQFLGAARHAGRRAAWRRRCGTRSRRRSTASTTAIATTTGARSWRSRASSTATSTCTA